MEVFLPIAEVQINVILILFVSFVIGFLSGLFGVGGGFLMTPFLIFMGIPPAYAVANEANNILASSSSGALTHWFKKTLDIKIGWLIISGGLLGTFLGILTFSYFKGIGKIDLIIALSYMYVLAIIGSFMLRDGIMEIDRIKKKVIIKKKLHTHYWIHGLPFRMRFKTSKLYESALVPIILGIIVGFIAAIMGVGGAFLMVPAMIYLIGMPTKLVPGTSLFVTIFVTAFVTISHAFTYHTIDLLLVLILITGSIVGVHSGQKIGQKLKGSELKTLLALLMLSVGVLMAYETFFKKGTASLRIPTDQVAQISEMGKIIFNLSDKYPIVYGVSSIFIALGAGVLVSYIRRQISQKINKKTI
ncbi:MAG: permease [Candidatus Pelagibacter sp. TMED64]|nr:permease [Candidatus Pelagibacter sp.]OUU65728.1 MAG: permease [Candidatus Pelagibacter sp. TMED64]|tara:strand:- start:459 stop:1535 length:1077 start_codon:yes stop_codon:yes gene_type:complete